MSRRNKKKQNKQHNTSVTGLVVVVVVVVRIGLVISTNRSGSSLLMGKDRHLSLIHLDYLRPNLLTFAMAVLKNRTPYLYLWYSESET